jgi:ankyrin repeat protein
MEVRMARQLPDRPSLDHLKHQAKDLLRDARAHDAAALARFRVLPAFAERSDAALARAPIGLHDAQSVIAREYGAASWNELRERVEESTLEFASAANAFVEAATDSRPDRAERMLTRHPGIARVNLQTALLLGDVETAERFLTDYPSGATEPGGVREWQPLHYICHSSVSARSDAREAGVVALARRLVALGADPNLRFPWLHHDVHRPVLWGAVFVTRSLPLAKTLLEAGATPNDGVTLTIAASAGHIAVLELLRSHGADVNYPWASDGSAPLYAILQWSRTADGARWLLEHGANPDPVFAANGETPLHTAAAAWDASLVEELVNRGADPLRRRADGRSPYAIAELNGNREVATWLADHGARTDVAAVDALVGACMRHDRAAVDAILAEHGAIRDAIADEHYAAFYRAAERNDAAALELMLACGFDPNRPDESIGKTALHAAAMEGWPDAVRVLLAHGASVDARDREFKAVPLIWAAEGSRSSTPDRDHAAVGRLLLDAGSSVEWQSAAQPAGEIAEIVDAWVAAG